MQIKPGKEVVSYRGPKDVIAWLREQTELYGSTVSAIISAACRKEMEREQAKARADRAAAAE